MLEFQIARCGARSLPGRHNLLKRSPAFAAVLVATLFVAACSGDSSTGPTADASATSNKQSAKKDTTTTVTSNPTTTPPVVPTTTTTDNVFWVNPSSAAKSQADAWRSSRPADASQMDKLASKAVASWFGDWNTDIYTDVNLVVTAAAKAGRVGVLVAYNIPSRDCGGLSGGGGASASAYRTWIGSFASAIAGRRTIVVVEPDALPGMDCLSSADQQVRVDLISYAVQVLKSQPNVSVYLDAGNPSWRTPADIAARLTRAGIAMADGFSLNISNFFTTASNVTYGQKVSALISGKHFIVDTSRNGLGPTADSQWCNPDGRAVGNSPTTVTGNLLVDAFLWVKVPGESDGACNGGPSAGKWWGEYALGLVNRSTL
ncbi:MAG: glycoside hydrolase family 6 protein [Gemmatimonadota bacterium]|nr:glycoside hydrolase family 6 protein [Gemmatimonadota bacterium]